MHTTLNFLLTFIFYKMTSKVKEIKTLHHRDSHVKMASCTEKYSDVSLIHRNVSQANFHLCHNYTGRSGTSGQCIQV